MQKIPGVVIAVVLNALMVVGAAHAQQLTPITIGLGSSSLATAAPRLAAEMGLFKKHGLDPKLTVMENSSVATMAVVAGSVNFNATSAVEVIVSQARGQDVVGISNLYGAGPAVLVLAKTVAEKLPVSPSAPATERLKALDGLIIASPSATSSYTFILKPSTEDAGAKVRITYLAQPAMVAAMESGAIHGFIASSPYYAKPILGGTGIVWMSGLKNEFPKKYASQTMTMSTTRSYADANKDIVKRVRAAMDEFSKAADERPAEVKAAMMKVFPDLDKTTADFLFESESSAWKTKHLSADVMAHELSVVGASMDLPNKDKLDPARMFYPY